MRRATLAALSATLALAGCGYFNAMYNAQRRFAEAESAAARGQAESARRAYLEAIEGAASSYRGHPEGRWADDALLLIAHARFRLGEHEAARAAARAAVAAADDDETAAAARVLAGAAEYRLGRIDAALAVLDSVVAVGGGRGATEALLWRARARFESGDEGAWDDLDAAGAADGTLAAEVALEAATRAFRADDAERFTHAARRLVDSSDGARFADSLQVLLESSDPALAHDAVANAERSPWPSLAREPLELSRARFLAGSGDTTGAVAAALRLASRATAANAAAARVLAATLDLQRASSVEDLERARATLLPAVADDRARSLLRTLRVTEVLLDRAAQGQPLALFAAAEFARDELHARPLAIELFLAYADVAADAVWAPKALLAAAAIAPDGEDRAGIAERFAAQPANAYVRAVFHDDEPASFEAAEERLARSLAALRFDAFREADQRDVRVGTAVARLDSLKARVLADSLRLVCGTLLDSLALAGVRADSVRSACLRGDTARVGLVLRMDTLLLRDTVRDTMRARIRRRAGQDTSFLRFP